VLRFLSLCQVSPFAVLIYCSDQKIKICAYAISALSFILIIAFIFASAIDPGYLKPEYPFSYLLENVHPCELCPDC